MEANMRPRPAIVTIQARVAERYGMTRAQLLHESRVPEVSHPRQLAMYLSRRLTPLSLPEIGRRFGGKHHTTVMHAVAKVRVRIVAERATRRPISRVVGRLEQ